MSTIGNIFQQSNPYEKFVQQLVQLESQTKARYEIQKGIQNEKKTAIGDVSSAISKFVSNIEELQDPSNNPFQPLQATSSNKDTVTVEPTSTLERPASFGITINRLASKDTVLSEVMNGSNTDLAALGDGSVDITIGDKTETIAVLSTYEDENGVVQQKTNSQILEDFSKSIDDVFGEQVRANRFNVSGDDVQFSMQSLETGFDNRIQFTGAAGFLDYLTTNTSRVTPETELNALFSIDGVNFERGQNQIDDAVDGLSFTLKEATGETEEITVDRDQQKARRNVDGFISAFNEMNRTIRDRTFIDADNNRRGPLQDNRSIRNLTLGLRQTGLLGMSGVNEGEASRLSEIGISFQNDGTMFVDDSELLTEMLTERPDEVARLFTDENSAISLMRNEADSFINSENGILSTIENGFDRKIDRLDTKIANEERFLSRFEEEQRQRFNELQAIIDQGDRQFAQIMNFRNSLGF